MRGREHGELHRLVALALAAREVDVERTVQQTLLEPDAAGLLEQQVVEPVDAPAASGERLAEHVVDGDAGHLRRVLHDEVQAGGGTLPRRHGEHVDAVERDRAVDDLVARLAHDDRRQRALAGAVGTHHGVHLAARHGEVDAAQDLLAPDGGTQVADLERGGSRRSPRPGRRRPAPGTRAPAASPAA